MSFFFGGVQAYNRAALRSQWVERYRVCNVFRCRAGIGLVCEWRCHLLPVAVLEVVATKILNVATSESIPR